MWERASYQQRDEMLYIRVSGPERAALEAAARRAGMPLSTWIRQQAIVRAGQTRRKADRVARATASKDAA